MTHGGAPQQHNVFLSNGISPYTSAHAPSRDLYAPMNAHSQGTSVASHHFTPPFVPPATPHFIDSQPQAVASYHAPAFSEAAPLHGSATRISAAPVDNGVSKYRSTSYNAYDPPIPSGTARRSSMHSTRTGVGSVPTPPPPVPPIPLNLPRSSDLHEPHRQHLDTDITSPPVPYSRPGALGRILPSPPRPKSSGPLRAAPTAPSGRLSDLPPSTNAHLQRPLLPPTTSKQSPPLPRQPSPPSPIRGSAPISVSTHEGFAYSVPDNMRSAIDFEYHHRHSEQSLQGPLASGPINHANAPPGSGIANSSPDDGGFDSALNSIHSLGQVLNGPGVQNGEPTVPHTGVVLGESLTPDPTMDNVQYVTYSPEPFPCPTGASDEIEAVFNPAQAGPAAAPLVRTFEQQFDVGGVVSHSINASASEADGTAVSQPPEGDSAPIWYDPYAPPKSEPPPSTSSVPLSLPPLAPSLSAQPQHRSSQSSTSSTMSAYAPIPSISAHGAPMPATIPHPRNLALAALESSYVPSFSNPDHTSTPSSSSVPESTPTVRSVYAPSPSQTAEDDPRTRARVPIFCFGFGGRVASCFHTQLDATTGVDIALTGRRSSPIFIRTLKSIIPSSAIEISTSEFPGPLFTGPSSLAIIKPTAGGVIKSKKSAVLKYLSERVEEVERGLGYVSSSKTDERFSVQGLAALLRALSVMVENDGQLSGSPGIDRQVREALMSSATSSLAPHLLAMPSGSYGFSTPLIDRQGANDQSRLAVEKDPPIATYTVRSSCLDRLQAYLLVGDRRQACYYALDQKLWAHAMLIASSLDKEIWKEAVNEFIRSELGVAAGAEHGKASNGRESMRILYSLFSGQGPTSIQELSPPKSLAKSAELLQPAAPSLVHTPISPNFPKLPITSSVSSEALSRWPETAATVISNFSSGEHASTLTNLGDRLLSKGWIEAAHVCYLLSPQNSPINGVGSPSGRVVLFGCENPATLKNISANYEPINLTEVVEFALSLAPSSGKDAFAGLPHLQAYKLARALQLAELGYIKEATKYCEAISSVMKGFTRPSHYFTFTFFELHKELTERLSGVPDKNTSWISRTMKKPTIDSLGTWSFDKLTKFIEGDDPSPGPEANEATAKTSPVSGTTLGVGPFSHYSEISSATTSQLPSPTGSTKGYSIPSGPSAPPARSGSAMSTRTGNVPVAAQIDRAASAAEYLRPTRTSSPALSAHRAVFSAGPSTTTFGNSSRYQPVPSTTYPVKPTSNGTPAFGASGGGGWWDDLQNNNVESEGATPVATAFRINGDEEDKQDEGNFVSAMDTWPDAATPSPNPGASPEAVYPIRQIEDGDEEDLGFGNNAHKKKKQEGDTPKSEVSDSKAEKPPAESSSAALKEKPNIPDPPPSRGWFSGWFSKKDTTSPAPVRANLGETKNAFYFDKELGKWIDGRVGASSAPAPTPPPSRARTVSPSTMNGGLPKPSSKPPPLSSATPPPPRAQSSMGLSSTKPPPPPASLRGPSGLSASFIPPTPGSEGTDETLPARAKSAQGQRKNARARYVDVFNNPPPS
ncbi:Sec23-binding domain of Sec16-domain-containing protein [Cantharellus anzutake]|uniref:Sec23-binding domain of Sec16-domain-containing protein n=1 Tax=Cantharellus anzutake TaxID=1750568 RepID=UPI0019051FA8|nr:Sec23-binding domain of Sec16-domain-containing protein [Cantharellus anzutake]KAF8334307.1 Sec23-binding domain of Sec16-domain-containing protein [Cantharellus anzutake]